MRDIRLTNGELLSININFLTLKMLNDSHIAMKEKQVNVLKKKIKQEKKAKNYKKAEELEQRMNDISMDITAEVLYVILRSNGMKIDREEAMTLVPADVSDIENMLVQFSEKIENFKKKGE